MPCCWRCAPIRRSTALAIAPGNAGTASIADQHDVDITSGDDVVALAREIRADLVVIGPEVPLVLGVADAVRDAGIACFGPSKDGGRDRRIQGLRQRRDGGGRCAHRLQRDRRQPSMFGRSAGPVRAAGRRPRLGGERRPAGRRARVWWSRRTATSHALTPRDCSNPGTRCCWSPSSTAPRCRCSASSTARPWCRCWRRRTSSASATATPAPTPAAWAPTRRCRGCRPTSTARWSADIVEPVAAELVRRGSPFSGLLYAGLAITVERACGHRIQLPLRRSGDAVGARVARVATWSAAQRRGDRHAGKLR